eukprot:TRINITY_DN10348_c0_g1_i3.p1 TRINITY_DN10348_c0_g1~~TRINITY_DN10348_c0_g1_i3.p1  ORF type:complete len:299 (+),score=64.43 TRINITY_DN10348_c0_g1_i3:46-942(+)
MISSALCKLLLCLSMVAICWSDRLLMELPMIWTHDSATGYLENHNVVTVWAKTQTGNFTQQLDCGARGFDLRPKMLNGKLIMHHGDVDVHYLFQDAFAEIVAWAGAHPAELVVPFVTNCDGDGCDDAVQAALDQLHVPWYRNCSVLRNLTVTGARQLGHLPGGGSVFTLKDCIDEQYDPSTECYVYTNGSVEVCYDASRGKDKVFDHMWQSQTKSANLPRGDDPRLWMIQGHWQYSVDSVALGELFDGSILTDNSKSGINAYVLTNVTNRDFAKVNIIELDNVCLHGPAIMEALNKFY